MLVQGPRLSFVDAIGLNRQTCIAVAVLHLSSANIEHLPKYIYYLFVLIGHLRHSDSGITPLLATTRWQTQLRL